MTEEQEAAAAVRQTAENIRQEAFELAQRYVQDQRPMTLNRIKELKEAADLLTWAAEGKGAGSVRVSPLRL